MPVSASPDHMQVRYSGRVFLDQKPIFSHLHEGARPLLMNQAEELAAAEALNQLRARRKAGSDQKPQHAQNEHAPTRAESIHGANGHTSPQGTPQPHKGEPQVPPERADATDMATAVSAEGDRMPQPHGAYPPIQPHLQPVLNSFPPSVDGTANAESVPVNRPWRNALLTATSMMLTKEARRKLRQLLAVLRLASEHLNSRVSALQTAMDADATSDGVKPKISKQAIRHDIITTIKKCLAMISTLATNSLPVVARDSVRNTILRLPSRWASQMEACMESKEEDGETESAILALATETLVSIRNITLIVSETLDRADNWVERLPRFRRGKRQRDEDPPTTEVLEPILDGPTRSSSSSSLYTALPVTRPSSPDADEKLPSPKAIKVAETEDEETSPASTPAEHSERSTAPGQ